MELYIKRSEDDVIPTEADVANFERTRDIALTKQYRQFLLRYSGGVIYPEMFAANYPSDHEIYDEMDELVQLDYLFPWQEFVEENEYDNDWNPAEFVAIGMSTAGYVLLKMSGEDAGSVHLWWRNNPAWGDPDDPAITGVIGQSFRGFLESLTVNTGGGSRWLGDQATANADRIEFEE